MRWSNHEVNYILNAMKVYMYTGIVVTVNLHHTLSESIFSLFCLDYYHHWRCVTDSSGSGVPSPKLSCHCMAYDFNGRERLEKKLCF